MRPAADGDRRSQWRGNAAADQDTVGQLGKHNPPRPAIPESETRSIAVSTERRLASRSFASADPTARGHRRDMADDPTRSIIEACPERRRWGKATRANPPPDRRDTQGAASEPIDPFLPASEPIPLPRVAHPRPRRSPQSSGSFGLPNARFSRIEAAICATCWSLCVRAFLA
jgi:hypothetical protein